MNKTELLQRAVELVLISHGVPEAALDDSYGPTMTILEADCSATAHAAIDLALMRHGVEPETSYDDGEFLFSLAQAL